MDLLQPRILRNRIIEIFRKQYAVFAARPSGFAAFCIFTISVIGDFIPYENCSTRSAPLWYNSERIKGLQAKRKLEKPITAK